MSRAPSLFPTVGFHNELCTAHRCAPGCPQLARRGPEHDLSEPVEGQLALDDTDQKDTAT